ncbi:MAG TPA: fused response regulator/phosphatase [Thermodesulfobacteriota bacterium]|nr:fused response regulator/phosphatase [Thermodesulfobacteriota bacterium]
MMSPRGSPLILIVDDEITTNRLIHTILTRAGFQTVCAFDVAGALAQIRERHPDLILLDVSLPDGSGFEVCRWLQGEPGTSQTPVLFISSHDDVSTKVQGFEAGGVDYITKPVAGGEVIARISTHLRLKQAYESLAELQAERIQRLAVAQEELMPVPEDLPDAHFCISLNQVLKAGGDFYDVISIGNQVVDYMVADASGHDLAASFWTAALKTLLAEYANPINSPREVVCSMNRVLRRILPEGVFFTLIYARLNRQNGQLSLINAGHPPAISIPGNGKEAVVVQQEGDVVGVFPDATYEATELTVHTGDRFFLYSDGLIEIEGTAEEGLRRLIASCIALRGVSLGDMVPSVVREVTGGITAQDDIVLMGVEV